MEATYQTQVIILKRVPANESDARITAYSRDKGKLELLVRGARKLKSKLAGHIEPITLSGLMVVRGRKYDYAGTAVSESCFLNIKNDLEKTVFAGKAIGFFDKIVKLGEKDKILYELLNDYLSVLNREEKLKSGYELFFSFFILRLLARLGHQPQLYNCPVCGRKITPKNNTFGFASGGVICPICRQNYRGNTVAVSDECIKLLRLAEKRELKILANVKVNKGIMKEFFNLANEFKEFCC